MTVSTKNFATLVSDQAAAIQARASALVDLTIGSILRAVVESCAATGLWLESIALRVAALTRAATSTGADLDSFVQDYGFSRTPANASSGVVTFSRFSTGSAALIPVGTQVQTADGTQTFAVVAQPANAAWNGSGGYIIAAGAFSVSGIPVQAVNPGAASNVLAGTVALILSAIPFVNTVTNPASMSGGADAESDAALRIGFQRFIASLASATLVAVQTAVSRVAGVMAFAVSPNINPDGSSHPGYITIVVDDGTGSPPSTLLTAVYNAVSAVVALGITFGVFGPTLVGVNVAAAITVATGYHLSTLEAQVQAAVLAYIDGLALGQTLYITELYPVIYGVSPGITDVSGLTLNGGTSDLTASGVGAVIRAGTITIT